MQFKLSEIKLIIGLGNIGQDYINTRHNAGFTFVEQIAQEPWKEMPRLHGFFSVHKSIKLLKPTTYMNESGVAVRESLKYFKIKPNQILVCHDDLDIKLGDIKLQFAKGPKKHNGIASIEQDIKTENFWRLRIGIESREELGNKNIPGMTFTLQRFRMEEMELLNSTLNNFLQQLK